MTGKSSKKNLSQKIKNMTKQIKSKEDLSEDVGAQSKQKKKLT